MSELWELYDNNGNKTGRSIQRGQAMFTGEYHLSVSVWIVNHKGEWLIAKRSPLKATNPGIWETCGGAAIAGEDSLAAALREAKEELGLRLDDNKGRLFTRITKENQHPPGGSCLIDVWMFSHECLITDIVLQPGETCDAKWASAETIRSMIAHGDFLIETDFEKVVENVIIE